MIKLMPNELPNVVWLISWIPLPTTHIKYRFEIAMHPLENLPKNGWAKNSVVI